jgi:predicted nucleic acid-binding protein
VSRVFFDAMMFVYALEDNAEFGPYVDRTLQRCHERGDSLFTSCLAVGEVMVGGKQGAGTAENARTIIRQLGFSLVPFDESCMQLFAKLRSEMGLKAPDAIHLACAAAARTDMFLTNDQQLLQRRLYVPGIQFIGDFTRPVL